jgi:hypothetical protein
MDLRFAKWEVSPGSYHPARGALSLIGIDGVEQNGKQGEMQSLGSANANAMSEAAGQEAQ